MHGSRSGAHQARSAFRRPAASAGPEAGDGTRGHPGDGGAAGGTVGLLLDRGPGAKRRRPPVIRAGAAPERDVVVPQPGALDRSTAARTLDQPRLGRATPTAGWSDHNGLGLKTAGYRL